MRIERLVAGTAAGAAQVLVGLRHRTSASAAGDIDLVAIGHAGREVIARAGSLGSGLAVERADNCAVVLAHTAEARLVVTAHTVLEAAAGFGRPAARGLGEAIDKPVAAHEHIDEAEVKNIVEDEGIDRTAALVVGQPGKAFPGQVAPGNRYRADHSPSRYHNPQKALQQLFMMLFTDSSLIYSQNRQPSPISWDRLPLNMTPHAQSPDRSTHSAEALVSFTRHRILPKNAL